MTAISGSNGQRQWGIAESVGAVGAASAFAYGGSHLMNGLTKLDKIDDARAALRAWETVGPKQLDVASLPSDDAAALAAVRDAYEGRVAGRSQSKHVVTKLDTTQTQVLERVGSMSSVVHGGRDAAVDATRELARTSGLPGVAVQLGDRHFVGTLARDIGVGNQAQWLEEFKPANRSIAAVIQPGADRPIQLASSTLDSWVNVRVNEAAKHLGSAKPQAALGVGLMAAGFAGGIALLFRAIDSSRPSSDS